MTDGEKLDLVLSKFDSLESEMQELQDIYINIHK